MPFRVAFVAAIGLILGTLGPAPARAETITVTAGSANIPWDDPSSFGLQGAGFSLNSLFSRIPPPSPLSICFTGCAPGTIVNLSSTWGGDAIGSLGQAQNAVFNGVRFADPADHTTWLAPAGTLVFDAPGVLLPPLPGGGFQVISLTAPFLFSGRILGFPQGAPAGTPPLFVAELAGRGTVDFRLRDEGVGVWRFADLTYRFEDQQPIPEPVTVVLVGSGLAGLLTRRLRRRRGCTARPVRHEDERARTHLPGPALPGTRERRMFRRERAPVWRKAVRDACQPGDWSLSIGRGPARGGRDRSVRPANTRGRFYPSAPPTRQPSGVLEVAGG